MNVFFTHTCLQSKTSGGQELVELLHFAPFRSCLSTALDPKPARLYSLFSLGPTKHKQGPHVLEGTNCSRSLLERGLSVVTL